MLSFIGGLVAGAAIMLLLISICQAAKEADSEELEYE